MPQDAPAAPARWLARIYAGIYRPSDGERVPVIVDGRTMPEGRFLLDAGP